MEVRGQVYNPVDFPEEIALGSRLTGDSLVFRGDLDVVEKRKKSFILAVNRIPIRLLSTPQSRNSTDSITVSPH
jgi:hypothetical protein